MTAIPQAPTIAALAEEYDALAALISELDPEQWALPTPCPGWSVRDQVAHVLGIESALIGAAPPAGRSAPTQFPSTAEGIATFNDDWIAALAGESTSALLDRLADVRGRRLSALRGMSPEAWDAPSMTPAGPDTYGRFMRIRVFDCWIHEQDIRDATGRPGHDSGAAVDLAVDETLAALGFIVGKRAGAPDGAAITLELTGAAARTVHVKVDGRAAIVPTLEQPADVTITMPLGVYTRLSAGRVKPAEVTDQVAITGDTAIGSKIIDVLAFTI